MRKQQFKQKGSALAVVLIILAVASILGVSILGVSLSDTKMSIHERNRIQALMLAKSGAEATLSAWSAAVAAGTSKPTGAMETLYLNTSGDFVTGSPSTYIGKVDVTVSVSGTDSVLIHAVGNANGVSQKITATIKLDSHQVFTDDTAAFINMVEIWYDRNGQVKSTNQDKPVTQNKAKVDPPSGNGILKFVQTDSIFEVTAKGTIIMKVDIWNFKNTLTLKADTIVFEKIIDFSHGGKIILYVNPGQTRAGKGATLYGKVQYDGVWYWFKDGMDLNDPAKQLTDHITGTDVPSGLTEKTVNEYYVKWEGI